MVNWVDAEYKGWSTSQWQAIVPASYSKIRYFFILQSLTTSKMRKFQTLKLSQFHKEKTCQTQNWWSSGIMSNFLGEGSFSMFWGANLFYFFLFSNIVASALKSCIQKRKKIFYVIKFFLGLAVLLTMYSKGCLYTTPAFMRP